MQPQAPGSQGARCALHFGQPFTAVCQRCGSYMCDACSEGGKFSVCAGCRSRAGIGAFPFRRDRFTWGELLAHSFEVYKRNFALLLSATLLVVAAIVVIQGLSFVVALGLADQPGTMLLLQGVLVIPQVVVQGVATLGMLDISVRVARGDPADLKQLFGSWRKLGKFLLQNLLVYAALLPAMFVFAVPMLAVAFLMAESPAIAIGIAGISLPVALFGASYVGLGVVFASMELAAQNDVGAIESIKNAWTIARSERLAILLCLILCLLSALLGLLACGIGVLFTIGFASVLFASVYLTLRNGAGELAR